jgi:Ca2+-transporting ATPase
MRTVAEILKALPTQPETGLNSDAIVKSRAQFGPNRLTPLPHEPLWEKFIEKFDEPIIKILLAAALLSMVVDLFKVSRTIGGVAMGVLVVLLAGAYLLKQARWVPTLMFVSAFLLFFIGLIEGHVLVEGLAVMVAVTLATGVAFASEYKSDREFEVLNARKESLRSKVIRGGQISTVAIEEVVVGDVVLLETGDEIPADGRLLRATEFMVDQSLMTGESEPVRKGPRPSDGDADGPDTPGCVYRGTQVVDGVAHLMVTEVGDQTYLGQIARRLSAADEDDDEEAEGAPETEEGRVKRKLTISKELTPLQLKLTNLAELISNVGYVAAVLIFLAQLGRGIWTGEVYVPTTWDQALAVFSELLSYFVTMVIIIVVAVPEGLPMSVTVSLALAMQKMTRANSLVRQLVACETIGSATVICSDKTGTLTQNKMQVDRIAWDDFVCDRGTAEWTSLPSPLRERGEYLGPWPRGDRPLDWIAINAAVNSTANLEQKEGKTVVIGNNTEGALLNWLREAGVEYGELRLQSPVLYRILFSSERKRMTTVIHYGERLVALVKGAPEWVLENSAFVLGADGSVTPMTDAKRQAAQARLKDAATRAMRTLAFAFGPPPPGTAAEEEALHAVRDALETRLVYVGFLAIRDPLRADVKDAVAECRQAGIEVKMITGDNVETARAIGHEIGLVERSDEPIDAAGGAILTSARFNELTDDQLMEQLPKLRILARARPLDKYRMVRLLQALDEVVAVTGDGTNDAPALKKADVGLAMGIAGTEVSKEASKIVLLDDAFSTIVKAVQWGRSLYENIQRFIQFQLTINVSALTITFLGILFFGVKAPFTVLQLLWINVIMDTFASIALCSEPPRPGVMTMPPKRKDENIVSPTMVKTIFITAGFFIVVMLALLLLMKGDPDAAGMFAADRNSAPTATWSLEVGGSHLPVPAKDLKPVTVDGKQVPYKFTVAETAEEKSFRGQTGIVNFSVLQVSLFFSIYVFFQVWNQISCRSLTPQVSGFHRILQNPTFLAIAGTVAIGQVLIVTFGDRVFNVEPVGVLAWIGIVAFTSTVLIFAEIARVIRLASVK